MRTKLTIPTYYKLTENPESIVYCNLENITFLTQYTLGQMISSSSRFECPHMQVSRKGNVCCELRGGSLCPIYREILFNDYPPAKPITQFEQGAKFKK